MGKGRPEPTKRDSAGRYKKDGYCFIATAVYGDYNAPEVVSLRRFRDERLKIVPIGRAFIAVYYKLSPPVAKYLLRTPHLSSCVRYLLDQFVTKLRAKGGKK